MESKNFNFFRKLIVVTLASYSVANIAQNHSCYENWNYYGSACWYRFNETDYCEAVETCGFYGNRLADNITDFIKNFSSDIWVYDTNINGLIHNLSCSSTNSDANATQSCPITQSTGLKTFSNCTTSKKFICSSVEMPVNIGLQSGRIKDYQMSTSSFYRTELEPIAYEAKFGRLENEYMPGTATQGGWCSRSTFRDEYFEVNFGRMVLVTGFAIQGVSSRNCELWVTLLNVSFLANHGKWQMYKNGSVEQMFVVNKDAMQKNYVEFEKPFIARNLRIYPVGLENNCQESSDRYCLRLEIQSLNLNAFSDSLISMVDSKLITPASTEMTSYYPMLYEYELQKEWPTGSYSLPRPKSGCPASSNTVWCHGYRLHDSITITEPRNTTNSANTHLQNSISSFYFVEEFCLKISTASNTKNQNLFPPGKYCIYKVGDTCPQGFESGSLRFYENKTRINQTWSHVDGVLPKHSIMFNASHSNCCYIQMYYCCRNDTTPEELELPSLMPFYLLPRTNECPDVRNTNTIIENFTFSVDVGLNDINKVAFGSHPYVTLSSQPLNSETGLIMNYHLCYYEPTVSNTTSLKLQILAESHQINADFPCDIALMLLYNGSLIQYGDFSAIWYNITISANCTVFSTEERLKSEFGISIYNGSLHQSSQCMKSVDITVAFHGAVPQMGVVSGEVNLTLVSRTNILIVLKNKSLVRLTSLKEELNQLSDSQESIVDGASRELSIDILSYNNSSEIIRHFQESGAYNKGSPRQLHGIIGVNIEDVQEILYSFTIKHDIPFVIGSTSATSMLVTNKMTLQHKMIQDGPLYLALSKLKEINITEVAIVRSKKLKIPTTFAYYLLQMSFIINKDVAIEQEETTSQISQKIRQLGNSKAAIYFIVDALTSSKLFIAAVTERISPKDGYIWISGSENGVYEHGIGSIDCYKLKPVSCADAFSGVLMMKSFSSVGALISVINGDTSNLNTVMLRNESSYFHTELMRAMLLDGVAAIADGIRKLSKTNATITTTSIILTASKAKSIRLADFMLTNAPNEVLSNGTVICLRGWTGANCSEPVCLGYHCLPGSGRCVGDRLCECLPGFYGRDCSGICKERCKNGICNGGALGDGTCLECNWMYEGIYCNKATVLQALIAGCIGTLIMVIIVACYLSKFCRPKQSSFRARDHDESHWIINWAELRDHEKIDLDRTAAARHLAEKFRYTDYYKAKFRGEHVFVTCIKKKPVKLSLDVRMEIRKVKQFDHVNVEKVKAVCLGPPYVAIVTDLASTGSLYDTLHAENVEVPLEIKYAFMEDICRGMLFLHEKCGMPHGRLKSTNCLLHKGWRLKITDIGLGSLRKNIETGNYLKSYGYYNYDPDKEKQDALHTDYNSLLWTAPEYLGSNIVNLDQIGHVKFEADVYSFGILMVEILTRRAPYGEIKVMSTQQIIEAVAHLREPMVDLEVIRPGSPRAGKELLSKQTKILRPSIRDDNLPKEEPGRSILKVLIESAWSDDPDDRPPFSHIKTVLRIIAPLKGDQVEKRAFLLEKETEALERYIAYDTRMINKERDKVHDWLSRSLPRDVYTQIQDGEVIKATALDRISVAAFRIADFQDIVATSSPDELICVIDYLIKSFHAVAAQQNLELTEIDVKSDLCVLVSNGRSDESSTDSIVRYCLTMLHSTKDLQLTFNAAIKLKFSVAVHTDVGVAGVINDISETARYRVVSKAVETTLKLLDVSRPNCLLVTEACAMMMRNKDKISLVELSKTCVEFGKNLRTYWVVSL